MTLLLSFAFPAIVVMWILPMAYKAQRADKMEYTLIRVKSNNVIFNELLNQQPMLSIDDNARRLVIGNPNAEFTITIINHPYCNHCASLHEQLIDFLDKYRDNVRVEIIFIGEPEIKNVIKFLIAIYLEYSPQEVEGIYSEWFKHRDPVMNKYTIDINSDVVNSIYKAQNEWKADNDSQKGTPSIYVNGRILPDGYMLEDIKKLFKFI